MNKNDGYTLPSYLQKSIIKLLCIYINKNSKLIDFMGNNQHFFFNDASYRNLEIEIKSLMLSISLVSKEWFETVSNNLNVSIDFNYKESNEDNDNDNEWSIIKEKNVKTLKLHFKHEKNQFYKFYRNNNNNNNNNNNKINFEILNKKIEKLSPNNFKKLVIRNIFPIYDQDFMTSHDITGGGCLSNHELINQHFNEISKSKFKNNIYFNELVINQHTTLNDIIEFDENIKSIHTIIIYECYNKQVLLKLFESRIFTKRVQRILLSNQTDENENISILELLSNSTTGENNILRNLSNIKELLISNVEFTIKELVNLLKSCSNIEYLEVHFCYDCLIYLLATGDERKHFKIPRCLCNCFIKNNGFNENGDLIKITDQEYKEFDYYWLELKKLLKDHKTLKNVKFCHFCFEFGGALGWELNYYPSSFVYGITSLFTENKSINIFQMMNLNSNQIFKQLIINNKNIIRYSSIIAADSGICDTTQYIDEINSLLKENNHIKTCLFLQEHSENDGKIKLKTLLKYIKE